MADWAGIRAAIATQMGYAASVRESTSTGLSHVGMLPAVKVERISSLELNPARGGRAPGHEARIARVEGKLLVARASDVGRAQVIAEGVVEELFDAARSGFRLGYSTIVEDSWLDVAALGEVTFGGSDYYGADLTWIVKTDEPVYRSSDRRGGFDIGFASGFGS